MCTQIGTARALYPLNTPCGWSRRKAWWRDRRLRPAGRAARDVCAPHRRRWKGEDTMLWTIFVILLVLWLMGMVTAYTLSGFIHLLLGLAVLVLIINLVQGRSTV